MRVEVINTGTELLLGTVINTHLRLFAQAIFPLGLRIARQVTVPDGDAIREALVESFARAEIVFVTGGLGPTTDDLTRDIAAELLGFELIHDEAIMAAITARFARRSLKMSERIKLQALRPREATVLHNDHGTAPGLYFPADVGKGTPHLFLLPGPPRELAPMVTGSVLPILANLLPPGARAEMRTYRIAGLGESAVEDAVGAQILALGLEIGYCARPGEVDLRTIGPVNLLDQAHALVIAKLGDHITSENERPFEQVLVELLTASRQTLAVAESCTGGYLANRLTNVPGASATFLAGYVTYANAAKSHTLGVDSELIARHGAVSAEVARAMAEGAVRASGADHALSTTGIAGPGGGSDEKPVGTVFIALASRSAETFVQRFRYPTDRETFKFLTTQTAFDLLRRRLRGLPLDR